MRTPLGRCVAVLVLLVSLHVVSVVRAQGALAEQPVAPAVTADSTVAERGEYVELNTGERLYGLVDLRAPMFKRNYLLIDDSTRIELDQVRAYRSGEGYFRRISGRGDTFARRVQAGRIDLYERTTMVMTPGAMMPGAPGAPPVQVGGGMTSAKLEYFAKEEGEVQPVKYRTLREAMMDDPESVRHLDQYRNLGYVQIGVAGVGLGIVAMGLTQLEPEGELPPLLFVGAAVAATAWIPHLMRPQKLRDAIRTYNR